jgi:hypothetical protein
MNMQEFEVVSRVDKKADNGKEILLMAIDFREPTFIKVLAYEDVNDHSNVNSDGKNCYVGDKLIGKVLSIKKGSDVSVNTKYDIKYTGGYSLDGETVYLDEHFPPVLKVQNKEIDIRKTIGLHHELPEKWMADEDYEYPYAHEIATGIEKKYVESLGVTWKAYCDEVDKNLRQVYRRTLEKSPPSLDLAPYLYCRDREALGEIRKSKS